MPLIPEAAFRCLPAHARAIPRRVRRFAAASLGRASTTPSRPHDHRRRGMRGGKSVPYKPLDEAIRWRSIRRQRHLVDADSTPGWRPKRRTRLCGPAIASARRCRASARVSDHSYILKSGTRGSQGRQRDTAATVALATSCANLISRRARRCSDRDIGWVVGHSYTSTSISRLTTIMSKADDPPDHGSGEIVAEHNGGRVQSPTLSAAEDDPRK